MNSKDKGAEQNSNTQIVLTTNALLIGQQMKYVLIVF